MCAPEPACWDARAAALAKVPVSNDIRLQCNWQGAFNVSPKHKGAYGYLTEWSGLGGLLLAKDIVVWNPITGTAQQVLGGQTVPCVGVLESFSFAGDTTDPIRVSCFVSKDNQTNIRAKLSRELVNTKIKAAFTVADYDESSKNWFGAVDLLDPKRLDAVVNTVDGELQVSIDAAPTRISDSLDIHVFRFQFEVVPHPRKKSKIQFAMGPNQKLVRQWGGAD
jgi:hypothetical protein